jgi:hypothetical protein
MSRGSLRLANQSTRISGRLRKYFDVKQKKGKDNHVSLMYAGTLSCPLFSQPVVESEEAQKHEEEVDVVMEER